MAVFSHARRGERKRPQRSRGQICCAKSLEREVRVYDRTKPSQTASPLGVLIVDDDEILREMLAEVLRIEGIQKCISADTLGSVQEQQKEALACGLAILDINLGPGEPT